MDWKNLSGPLLDAGLTVLGSAIGGPSGAIAVTVGREVARQLGVTTPQEALRTIEHHPHEATERLRAYEAENEEMLRIYAAEQRHMAEALKQETQGPLWTWAWRPATMWLIAFLWLWAIVLVPTVNAAFPGLGVPLPPFDTLFGFTGLFLALYMGGHTAIRMTEQIRGK